jgi:hypothetical protein
MKFEKPIFDELQLEYQADPESVHDCSRIYRKDPEIDVTASAVRMSEALVLANRLVRTRADISALTSEGGSGDGFLLGRYGFKANLCPHGLARGARDLAYFLQDHWGRPTLTAEEFDYHTTEVAGGGLTPLDLVKARFRDLTGIIGFFRIDGFAGQGHIDVWDGSRTAGKAYWSCRKVIFWKLD